MGGCRLGLGRVKSFLTWMNKGWERGWYAGARRVQGGQGLILMDMGESRKYSTGASVDIEAGMGYSLGLKGLSCQN